LHSLTESAKIHVEEAPIWSAEEFLLAAGAEKRGLRKNSSLWFGGPSVGLCFFLACTLEGNGKRLRFRECGVAVEAQEALDRGGC
jgi:hypothetical protein